MATLSTTRSLFAGFLLILLSVGFYINTLNNDFVWDDRLLILENPYIQDTSLISEGLLSDFWKTYEDPRRFRNFYRPAVILTFFIDYSIWGDDPSGFHLTNIILHTANVLLLFLVTLQLFRSLETSFFAAVLFAVHPIHTESVAWISGRTDLLASLGVLSSFYCYLKAYHQKTYLYLFSGLLYILALLSKEVAIVLPAAMVLHISLLGRSESNRSPFVRAAMVNISLTALYLLFRVAILQIPLSIESRRPLWLLVFNMPRILAQYFLKLMAPIQLHAHDPLIWLYPEKWLSVLSSVALVALTAMFVLWLGRKDTRAYFGAWWLLLFLLPVLNAGTFTDVLVAERFLYVPSIGFCWIMASFYERIKLQGFSRKLVWAAASLIIMAAGMRTWYRIPVWKDQLTLFSEMSTSSPHYPLPHLLLGEAHQNSGNAEEALKHYQYALRLDPNNCRIFNAIALAQLELGVYTQSGSHLDAGFQFTKQALELCEEEDFLHHTLGEYYLRQGDVEKAVSKFRDAIEINPFRTGYYYNVGAVLFAMEKKSEARPYLERYMETAPKGDLREQALKWLKE